jgi:hypothetical protein
VNLVGFTVEMLWAVLKVCPVKSIHAFHPEGVAVIIIIIIIIIIVVVVVVVVVIITPIIATLHNHCSVLCDLGATIV